MHTKKQIITETMLSAFIVHLHTDEREESTVQKYVRYVGEFMAWLDGKVVTKELAVKWKEALLDGSFAPATINGKIAAVNAFFKFAGWEDCRLKALRLQRRVFMDPGRDLDQEEYEKLIQAAYDKGDERLALLMETICATGIRVSEVKYITVKAVSQGRALIALKGKIRTIILPGKLCKRLRKYIKKKEYRLRRGVPHQKRKRSVETANMGGNEEDLSRCGSGGNESVPPQPPPPVRTNIL